MDELKTINAQIRKVFFELIFAVLLFVLALIFFITPNKSLSNYILLNKTAGQVSIEEVKPLNLKNIYPIDDEEAIHSDTNATLKIQNHSKTNSRYILAYRVDKNSTLNTNYLKYQIIDNEVNKIDFLDNLGKNKSDNYIDYIISTGELTPKEKKEINFNMWLDHKVGNEAQGKSLTGNFVITSYDTAITMK